MYALGHPLYALASILDFMLLLYTFVVLAVVILGWTNPDPLNPLVRTLRGLTEPVFDKIRKYVPLVGGIDLTPLVVVAGIFFVRTGILSVVSKFAQNLINA
jgi:YggT family protein